MRRDAATPPGSGTSSKTNLHALWDELIGVQAAEVPRDLATLLEKQITKDQLKVWASGAPEQWAWESYTVAHDSIYPQFKPGTTGANGVPLPPEYYSPKMRAIVNEQIERAGVRLAYVLNLMLHK
jgi:S1/P1 Nuclease